MIGVEDSSDSIAELGRKSVVDGLYFLNPCLRDRHQADACTVALDVIAAIELIIDSSREAVCVDLSRYTEFGVGTAAHVGLLQDEIVRVSRDQRKIPDGVGRQCRTLIGSTDIDDWCRTGDDHFSSGSLDLKGDVDCGWTGQR